MVDLLSTLKSWLQQRLEEQSQVPACIRCEGQITWGTLMLLPLTCVPPFRGTDVRVGLNLAPLKVSLSKHRDIKQEWFVADPDDSLKSAPTVPVFIL